MESKFIQVCFVTRDCMWIIETQEINNMYNGGGIYFADSGDLTHSVMSLAQVTQTLNGTVVRCALHCRWRAESYSLRGGAPCAASSSGTRSCRASSSSSICTSGLSPSFRWTLLPCLRFVADSGRATFPSSPSLCEPNAQSPSSPVARVTELAQGFIA